MVILKKFVSDDVERDPIYFSIQLKDIRNFLSDEFPRNGKFILEHSNELKLGELVLIRDGEGFFLMKIDDNFQIENILFGKIQFLGKVIYREIEWQ